MSGLLLGIVVCRWKFLLTKYVSISCPLEEGRRKEMQARAREVPRSRIIVAGLWRPMPWRQQPGPDRTTARICRLLWNSYLWDRPSGRWVHGGYTSTNSHEIPILCMYFYFSYLPYAFIIQWIASFHPFTSCKKYPSWTASPTLQGSWFYPFPNLNYRCYTFSVLTLPFVDISTESLTFPHIHDSKWNHERPDKHLKPKINWKVFFLTCIGLFSRFSHLSNLLAPAETLPTTEQEEMSVFFSLCTRIKFLL